MIEQGPGKLLPTNKELWTACTRGIGFDENDQAFPDTFSKCTAGLVDAYRRSVVIWHDTGELPLDWPNDVLVPDGVTISGPHAEAFHVAIEEILGYQISIDIDAYQLLPRPLSGAEPYQEPLSTVIARVACHYALLHNNFGYLKHGFSSDQGQLIAAERAYSTLSSALEAGDVYLPPVPR
ncbi:hypothetical protein [Nocardia carnea]|uniref:hypothetical protein n=1 Tax=Nocardia carnea TaxID=37328 RepID=UPI000307B9A5|nr:hypothetical protein [Nocardia carnea]